MLVIWYKYRDEKLVEIAVAPYAGAWVEIVVIRKGSTETTSLPTRERGLKFRAGPVLNRSLMVAPYAGAWVEIRIRRLRSFALGSRSLRGSVG